MIPDAPVIGGYGGRMQEVCDRADALETQGARRQREAAEARAIADPTGEGVDEILVADGGEPNAHAAATNEMLNKAEEVLGLETLRVGLEVSVDGEEDTPVIMRRCDRPAGEYYLETADESVAEYNDAHASEDVYQVVFPDESDQDLADLTRYPYPRSCLMPLRLGDGGEE